MSRKNEFKILEKQLKNKFVNLKENEIILNENDFRDGKLTKSGYLSLKLQSDYISISEDIEIKIPKHYKSNFKQQLEYVATKELIRIKSDMKDVNLKALIFISIGILLLTLPTLIDFFKQNIINELILIVSWVFSWAAVEKKFFKMYDLKNRKQNILHILTAKLNTY